MKKSVIVIHRILRLFVNTLTVDEKHYLLTRDNLTQTIQIQLSQKQKTLFEFFLHFQKLSSILNICQKRMTLIADVFQEILPTKNMVREMSKKPYIRGPSDRKNGKWVNTLKKSECQQLYNIH